MIINTKIILRLISPLIAIKDEYLPQITQITQITPKKLMPAIFVLFSKLLKSVLNLCESVKSVAKQVV